MEQQQCILLIHASVDVEVFIINSATFTVDVSLTIAQELNKSSEEE